MNNKDFRKHAHEFVDWIADYFEQIEQYPVKSQVKPGDIKNSLPTSPPLQNETIEQIFEDFQKIILPGISHWQHPGWFAYFPANNSPASVLGEFLTAALGVQGMIWDTSPAATELEEVVVHWLRDMLGLPGTFTGVIQDTASTASLCALISARERTSKFGVNEYGFEKKMRIYTSSHSHSSIEKGVKIAGFGKENLVLIDTTADFSMKPDLLKTAIEKDLAHGYIPCCVSATLGTTSSMAMDPIDAIARICQQYNIWLHVDAALAGTAAIVPEFRNFMQGVEKADSFVFNPHKWMLTNFDCSVYLVQDPMHLQRSFSILPEYLKTASTDQVNNYRDWGIQLGRRFRSLKLWFVIRSYGIEGLQQMVRSHVALARSFAQWVDKHPDFEMLAPANLNLVCFRYYNPRMSREELNTFNETMLGKVNASGEVYLTHTLLNGHYCLRLSVGQRNTALRHVEKAWLIIQKAILNP